MLKGCIHAACSGGDASQLLVLPASKKQKTKDGARDGAPAAEEPAPLSKAQLRKLKQVQQKKERRENIGQVLASLNSSSISSEHLSLLRPMHQRGARETKKQRLKRMLQLERAGVALDEEAAAELYRPRKAQQPEQEDDSEEGSSEEEEEVGERRVNV